MIDFALDDLDLAIENNDLVMIDGAERVRQHVEIKLKLFAGEWFLDTEFGTPYLSDILGKQISLGASVAALKKSILEVDGVQTITRFDYTFNRAARNLDVDFDVQTPYGNLNILPTRKTLTSEERTAKNSSNDFPLADNLLDILINETIPLRGY